MKGSNPLFSKFGTNKCPQSKYAKSPGSVVEDSYNNKTGEKLIQQSKCDDTKQYIKQIYRHNATEGDGSLAYAIAKELETGEFVGGKSHIKKGQERVKQAKNVLKKFPDHPDKKIWFSEAEKIEKALKKGKKK